jgi:hypothetical protein
VAELARTLARYGEAAGEHFDFGPASAALADLRAALDRFYAAAPAGAAPGSPPARRFNAAQRRLARILVPINYTRAGRFRHDPALDVPPLPDLAPALGMGAAAGDSGRRGVLQAHLRRGQNRLVWALQQARETVEAALPG